MLDQYTLSGQEMVTILQAIATVKNQSDSALKIIDSIHDNFTAVSDYCDGLTTSIQDFMTHCESGAEESGQQDE